MVQTLKWNIIDGSVGYSSTNKVNKAYKWTLRLQSTTNVNLYLLQMFFTLLFNQNSANNFFFFILQIENHVSDIDN